MRSRLLLLLGAALAACSGDGAGSASSGENGGTLVIALPASPGVLNPAVIGQTQEKQIIDQVFDVLAEIGPDRNTVGDRGYAPRLAHSWTWAPDSLSIAFSLNPDARWHDDRVVTSGDVKFSVELYKDPATNSMFASGFADIDSISTPDSLTAVMWYSRRSPEMFYNTVYNLLVLPSHLLADADRGTLKEQPFARHPIGSGPFRFTNWEPGQVIEVTANEQYHLGRPRLNRVIWQLYPDPATAVTALLSGNADLLESPSTDAMAQIATSSTVRAVPFPGLVFTYLGFNRSDASDPRRPHPIFSDRRMREAIAMSLDRRGMLVNVFDTLAYPASGPFTRIIASADSTIPQPAFDTTAADRLLDSLGWTRGSNGMRQKGGRPLRFGILYPATSPPRARYAPLIQAQLRARGIQADIEAPDVNVLGPRMVAGQFDAVLNSAQTDPSPSGIRGGWYSKPPERRERNFLAYANPAFDATVDSASRTMSPDELVAMYRRAYRILVADVPAVWLYETRTFIGLHNRVRTVGEDVDFWWRFLRNWYIPANERITRDR